MQLKSLDIHGFKSFPDRVALQFDQGITAVVGPNGSGKSNIADAVRWVLGEQSGKTLRSGKMEDVIFSGTQHRKPMGYASVTITIDNADRSLEYDSDEVIINRRIYRSGESEYRINGTAVRLKDILEMFMDTGLGRDGYSIIGQGKIAEIVSAKSLQRREIFEEAAGISKYRYRKEQAEKRLEQAQENLLRLKDIILELQGRVEPLRIQSQKAQEYLEYAQHKRTLEVSIWLVTIERSKDMLREQQDKLLLAQGEHEQLQEQLEGIEAHIQELYELSSNCNVELDTKRREISAAEQASAQYSEQIAVWNNDIKHNETMITRMAADMENQSASRKEILEHLMENQRQTELIEKEIQETGNQIKELENSISVFESESRQQLQKQVSLSQQKAEVLQSIADERLKLASSSAILEQMEIQKQNAKLLLTQNQVNLTENINQLKNVDELLLHIDEEILAGQNIKKGYLMKHKSSGDEIAQFQKKQSELTAQQNEYLQKARLIEDMEKNMEGYQSSVKYIMKQAKNGYLKGIEGPVSTLIKVEGQYAVAIEVALAGALQNIVVTTESAAKAAIEVLKSAHAGRATFLPISAISGKQLEEHGLAECDGFIAIAYDLIACNEKYCVILKNLLGRIVVADNLDNAIEIAKKYKNRFRIVTLDGQVIHPGGSMTGGSLSRHAGILSRAGEIQKLKQQAQFSQDQLDKIQIKMKEEEKRLSQLSAYITSTDADLKTMSEDKIRYESEKKRLQIAIADLEKQQTQADSQMKKLKEKLSEFLLENNTRDETILKMSQLLESLNEDLDTIDKNLQKVENNLSQMSEEKNRFLLQQITLTKDQEALKLVRQQITQQFDMQAEQTQALSEQIEKLQADILSIQEDIQIKSRELENLNAVKQQNALRISDLENQRDFYEKKSVEERKREKEIHAKVEILARDLAKIEERRITLQNDLDSIIARLYDEYELTLTNAQELQIPILDIAAANRELNIIKAKIKALGNINVSAIEEYREVHERYEFLRAQVDDIEKSKQQLTELIHHLTHDMKELFLENFNQINCHFEIIFAELFSGGNAKLLLTQPDDVLESGIEIYVQPPGKIIKNLAALSGGEQAFVAIAIYFAILKVRPSPFCLLDEIEAALDDVNVVKYARYLRRLVSHTQFIAITHRRGTMEEADVLYGVTMQEEGVSKLLRLGVSELESKLGMK